MIPRISHVVLIFLKALSSVAPIGRRLKKLLVAHKYSSECENSPVSIKLEDSVYREPLSNIHTLPKGLTHPRLGIEISPVISCPLILWDLLGTKLIFQSMDFELRFITC